MISKIFKQSAIILICGLLPTICRGQHRNSNCAEELAKSFCTVQLHYGLKIGKKVNISSHRDNYHSLEDAYEAYYIFQIEDKGFVIVSGDERMPDILAYSESTTFDIDNIPPAVRYWLDCYEEVYQQLNYISAVPVPHIQADIDPLGIPPLLGEIQWGQGTPYNQQCPSYAGEKCLTGCVATAMAQVMKFHEYPAKGQGTSSYRSETNRISITRDLNNDVFKWEDMLDQYKGNYSTLNANAVATLMASCGAAVQMDYGINSQGGSGAYQTDLLAAFVENYSYDPDAAVLLRSYCSTDDWHTLLINELNEGRPVNYAGHSTRDGGHSFVIDGYRPNPMSNYPDYHVNWGWNGSCDGYYQIANLQPVEGGNVATLDGFNSSQQMTIHIHPDDGIDEHFIFLGTEKLRTSVSNCKAGDSLKLSTSSFYNWGYNTFNGSISAVLISEEDIMKDINATSYKSMMLKSLEQKKDVSLDITLPENLDDGVYTLQLVYTDKNSKDLQKVYSRSYPQIVVSANGEKPVPPTFISSTLGCSEVEFIKNKTDDSEIKVKVYELQNLEEAPFLGEFQMMIADRKGMGFMQFGEAVQSEEMGRFEITPDPIVLTGKLTGEWPDGSYRLYIGARPFGSTEFSPVSFYDTFNFPIIQKELYFEATVQNGQIHIGNKSYDIVPEYVKGVLFDTEDNVYVLDGKKNYKKSAIPHIHIVNGKKVLF